MGLFYFFFFFQTVPQLQNTKCKSHALLCSHCLSPRISLSPENWATKWNRSYDNKNSIDKTKVAAGGVMERLVSFLKFWQYLSIWLLRWRAEAEYCCFLCGTVAFFLFLWRSFHVIISVLFCLSSLAFLLCFLFLFSLLSSAVSLLAPVPSLCPLCRICHLQTVSGFSCWPLILSVPPSLCVALSHRF